MKIKVKLLILIFSCIFILGVGATVLTNVGDSALVFATQKMDSLSVASVGGKDSGKKPKTSENGNEPIDEGEPKQDDPAKLKEEITDLKTQIENLNNEMASLKKEIEDLKNQTGNFNIVLLIVAALSLLCFISIIILFRRLIGLEMARDKELKELSKLIKNNFKNNQNVEKFSLANRFRVDLKVELKELSKRISSLETNLNETQYTKNTFAESPNLSPKTNVVVSTNINKKTEVIPQKPKVVSSFSSFNSLESAFNNMIEEAANAPGMGSITIKQEFVNDRHVIMFKCVNYDERANNSHAPLLFAKCTLAESTLWGVPQADGTLAVLPNLSSYETNIHFYGGMKELFISGYKSGSYKHIKVSRPAIMTTDFQILRQGELVLG